MRYVYCRQRAEDGHKDVYVGIAAHGIQAGLPGVRQGTPPLSEV